MSSESQLTPRKLLNYRLQHELGQGGMATVWYAENSMGRPFAIKLLKPGLVQQEPSIAERFRNEAKIMVRLNHPHIRRVEDYYEDDHILAIIMEYLDGEDLHHYIRNKGAVPERLAIDWFREVLDAFMYVHSQGYFHRDVKPSNLFLTKSGQMKVVDFGIAKIVGTDLSLTHTDMLMGSPLYMSPEQIQTPKKVDFRTDIYSLGVTLYTLLSGEKPYDEAQLSAFGVQSAIVHEPLPPLPFVSDALNEAIQKATRKDPARRFANCADFSDALTIPAPPSDEATVLQSRTALTDEATIVQPRATTTKSIPAPVPPKPEDETVLMKKPQHQPVKPVVNQPDVNSSQITNKKLRQPLLIVAVMGVLVLMAGIYFFLRPINATNSNKEPVKLAKIDSPTQPGTLSVVGTTSPPSESTSSEESQLAEKGIALYKQANYKAAFAILTKLEQQAGFTNPEALTDLGVMYYYGDGIASNLSRARQLFLTAETPKAKYFLGMIEDGITNPKKGESRGVNARSVALYRESADGGDAYGQATMGRLFLLGNSFLRAENPCVILDYLQRAKAAGVVGAANNYSVLKKRGHCP